MRVEVTVSPGLSVLTSLLVSVDVKLYYIEPCFGTGHNSDLSLICQLTSEDIKQHFSITMAFHLDFHTAPEL